MLKLKENSIHSYLLSQVTTHANTQQ